MNLKSTRPTAKIWVPDWLTLISGLLIVFSFPPWDFWPLIWVCLIPWFAALTRAKTLKVAVIQGFWLSFIMSLGGFYWVAFVLQEFGNLPWILAFLGLLLFCCFGQPQFILTAYLLKALETRKKQPHPIYLAITLSFFYVGIDWILPKMFMDTLGHAFYLARHLRQIADLGGAWLLSFMVFLVNYALWDSFQALQKEKRFRFSALLGTAFCVVVLGWSYGFYRYRQVTQEVAHAPHGIQGAAIQGNIGDFDKIAAERGVSGAATKVISVFTDLTDQALQMRPRPDFVVWPETSYPSTFRNPHSLTEVRLDHRLEQYVRSLDVPLLFGGYDHAQGKDFNAFFFLSPQGELQTYHKNILLLFGEYIPGAESFQILKDTFPQVGNFGRGIGPDVLTINTGRPEVGSVKVGPIICYEALFTDYVVEAARKGSQLILNITNDSWFGSWGEPQLHLALTAFRSIETHLPMLRATNTGISTLILPDGEITHSTKIDSKTILNVFIPLTPPIPTLIKEWGDWFGPFSLLIGLLGLATLKLRNAGKSRRR